MTDPSLAGLEVQAGIAVVTLADPARRNVLSPSLVKAFRAALAKAHDDPTVHGIVLTGAGSAFCAGADLADLIDAGSGKPEAVEAVYDAIDALAESQLPTLAAVNGPAVGAGLNLALACDMRIAGTGARFDTRFLQIGLHPGGGHGWMLLRAVGWAEASRLLLCGAVLDAAEARRIGLAQDVVADDLLLASAREMLAPTLRASRDLLLRTKASLHLAACSTRAACLAQEALEQRASLAGDVFTASMKRAQAGRSGRTP